MSQFVTSTILTLVWLLFGLNYLLGDDNTTSLTIISDAGNINKLMYIPLRGKHSTIFKTYLIFLTASFLLVFRLFFCKLEHLYISVSIICKRYVFYKLHHHAMVVFFLHRKKLFRGKQENFTCLLAIKHYHVNYQANFSLIGKCITQLRIRYQI